MKARQCLSLNFRNYGLKIRRSRKYQKPWRQIKYALPMIARPAQVSFAHVGSLSMVLEIQFIKATLSKTKVPENNRIMAGSEQASSREKFKLRHY